MKNKQIDDYRHSKPRESLYLWALSKGSLMPTPLPLMNKASWFVLELHKDEERDDGSEYSGHPSDTCRIALSVGITDDATLASTLLHDTREHNKANDEELRQDYNDEVADIVDDVTLRPGEYREDNIKRIEKRVKSIIVKGCDRLSNLGTMIGVFSIPKIKRYSKETKKDILPMLERARHTHIEYSDPIVALRDSIERILKTIDAYVEEAEEKETYKEELMKHNTPLPEIKRIPAMPRDLNPKILPDNNDSQEKETTPLAHLISKNEQKKTSEFIPLADEVEHVKQ